MQTCVVHLIRALDLMSQRGIRVANLSLAGPENTVLSDMLAIPNLWQQAAGAARRAGCRILLGPGRVADDALPVTPVAAAGLALLGAAMLVWRVSATLTLLIVLYRLLEPAGLESAVVLPASASLLLGLAG